MKYLLTLVFALLLPTAAFGGSDQTETDLAEQEAWASAIEAVADSVVQIHTVGGLDRVGKQFVGQGPTTGLVVSEDGYIVSSAFNFAGQPTSILVRLASGRQFPARLIARDKNRMLVLLKIASDSPLPIVEAVVSDEIKVGQWAISLGRTFRNDQVDVSVGIVSGLNRMYGRVIQTDANVSAANYGGPLVDIHGRVLGILVPMAPQAGGGEANSEVAGAEYYDSGIGFAVPLEHLYSILDRWKQGEDLLPGKLGVGLAPGAAHLEPPKISAVWPQSPASEAGWQTDDTVVAIDGKPVATQADMRFQIMARYAGDILNIKIRRGDETIDTQLTLTGELAPYRHAFLGVLPAREIASADETEKEPGLTIRGIWPDSPAAKAGLQAGDRLLQIGANEVNDAAGAISAMNALHPDEETELVAMRGEEKMTLTAETASLPVDILARADLSATNGKGDKPSNGDAAEPELETIKLPEFSQESKFLSPPDATKRSLGLLLWLGDGSEEGDQELADAWQSISRRDDIVLLIAHPEDEAGWSFSDLEYLDRLARTARTRWKVSAQRMAVGGHGKAGQLAYALAFQRLGTFAGAIGVDSPLPRTLRIPENRPGSRLATLAVESRNSTFAPLLRHDLEQLREAGYSASWWQRPITNEPSEKLDEATCNSIARWIDGLDRF